MSQRWLPSRSFRRHFVGYRAVTAETARLGSSATITNPTAPRPPLTGPATVRTGLDRGLGLADFTDLKQLGRGGMGVVYKAWQKSQNRPVALKLLRPKHRGDPVCLERFLREARATSGLGHPNIIQVYRVDECRLGPYFVMEYVDGPSLEQIVRDGPVSLLWAVNLMIRLAETLQYAHARGVLHRDLKPANVLVEGGDRPVLIDFGLACFLEESSGLTQQGEVLGTPSYMAPEQASADWGEVGPASDVYALGAILYTLLTRRVPYEADSDLRTIMRVVSPHMPVSIRSLRPEVPAELERICTRCLSKAVADRYPSGESLAADLRRFRAHLIQG